MAGDAITVSGLTKRYGDHLAVDAVSFEVRDGESFGILGPNGAGKTTTLEMIEGLTEPDGSLSPVQQAFNDCHGLQCGFCTPGFLTTITAGLEENPDPTEDEAREMIAGNLCRCTGYQNIVKSVLRAAELGKGEQ